MLLKNKDNFSLTLQLVSKTDNELIKKENGVTTLISEDKIIYLYINDQCESGQKCSCKCLRKLKKYITSFVKQNKYDVNVNIASFCEFYQPKHEEAFRVIIESIMFENNKTYSMKSGKERNEVNYNLIYNNVSEFDEILSESTIKMEFVNFARSLQDLPPNIGTSVYIADKIKEKASEIESVKCTVYTKSEIEKMGMGLLLAVNAASEVEPRVVVLEYCGDSSKPKTALVGKGITFDSGGYNLKPSAFMKGMKFDMSGAAIMSSTVMALAKAKAKANVMSVACLTDNRIGGHGTLTESIIKSMNGQTVQIDNTDAEGRLVLADGITYAFRNGKADQVIDSATLTGAIVVALGH